MSHDKDTKDTELNNIKLFGNLNTDIPIDTSAGQSLLTGLFEYPLSLLTGFGDSEGGDLGLVGAAVAGAQSVLFASQIFQAQEQHTTKNLLSTRNYVFIEPPGGVAGSTEEPIPDALFYSGFSSDQSDGFRQSIGSPWTLSRLAYGNNTEDEDAVLNTNIIERLKRSHLGDYSKWQGEFGAPSSEYCVLNAYSTPYADLEALPQLSFVWGDDNYSYLTKNYSAQAYIERIGITSPSYIPFPKSESMISDDEVYKGNWVQPVFTAGKKEFKEREEFVYILWRDDTNAAVNTAYQDYKNADISDAVEAKNTINRLKLLSLFFTINQKRSGYSVPSSISSALLESTLHGGTSLSLQKIEKLNFDFDGESFKNSTAYYSHTGFDALLNIKDFAEQSKRVVGYQDNVAYYEDTYNEVGEATGQTPVYGPQTPITDPISEPSLMLVKDVLGKYLSTYTDMSFNYSRAIDSEMSHIYGEELTDSQPTFSVTPFYNNLSPAYETVTTQTNISVKALPNIYEIIQNSNEGFDFEKYGNQILTCPNTEIESINSDPKTMEKSNIVIAASTYGKLSGFQAQMYESGDIFTSEILPAYAGGIPDHARGMSPSTFNESEEAKKLFPFGIQIDFFGDEKKFDGEVQSSLSMTNANKRGVPISDSIQDNFLFDENIQAGTDILFSSGIVYDFIKTLIYSHFAGDNLSNPPSLDPEKFAAQGGPPWFDFNGPTIVKAFSQSYSVRRYLNEILDPSTITLVPYPENVWYKEENQAEYDFLNWLDQYASDRSTENTASKLYKNNGDVGKVSVAYGNEQIKEVYSKFLSLDLGDIGNYSTNFKNWASYNITGQNYFAGGLGYDDDYFPQDNFLGGDTQKQLPLKFLHRTYKECISETSYSETAYATPTNIPAIQQTLFYRIAKYDEKGELLQNIFIPAHGAVIKGNQTKLPKPFYRYIDTQVKYGQLYRYKVSCYKMVLGTSYKYDFAPYDTSFSDPHDADSPYGTSTQFIYNRSKRMEKWAEKLGFDPTPGDFIFHEEMITSGDKSSRRIMPCFDKLQLVTTGVGGGSGKIPGHGNGSGDTGHGDAVNDAMVDFPGENNTNSLLPTEWKLLMFAVRSVPTVRIIEVPYFDKLGTMVLDKPPLPPLVNMHPLSGKKNDILISFEHQTGESEQIPISILASDEEFFKAERIQQNRMLKDQNGNYLNPSLLFKSDDFPSAYEIFKIKDTKPFSYADFSNSDYKKLLVTDATSYVDKIETNTKYYYVFRTIDLHGNISNPSPLYEVEMVENSGVVFPTISVVEFDSDINYVYSKSFRKHLKIDASTIQSEVNETASGLINGETAYNPNKDPKLGPVLGDIWDNNQPYKFRIRSRHTGKTLDLNVRFRLRHNDMYEPPTDCYDNVKPGGIISKGLEDYIGSDGEGDL